MSEVSRGIDRIKVTFDEPNLVANAGLLLVATLTVRLGLERLINATVHLSGRVGGALPGRKVLTLVHAMAAGGSHIDHAEMLRSGATQAVLGHQVMAPSTLGTFLRAFTFGHVRQLDRVLGEALRRAWALGAGPGSEPLVMDLDSTICVVCGKAKHGAGYGYTRELGYHPLIATRAGSGEVLHVRMRRGSGIICIEPSSMRLPRRSEKRINVRAKRRAVLSTEKLSILSLNSIACPTKIRKSATANRGRCPTRSSIADVVQVMTSVFSSAIASSSHMPELRKADSPKNSSVW